MDGIIIHFSKKRLSSARVFEFHFGAVYWDNIIDNQLIAAL